MNNRLLLKSIVLVCLGVIATSALAAGTGLNQFTPPPGDASVDYLRDVFGRIATLVSSGGDTTTGAADDALSQMMVVYGTAVLFLGQIFVGYTIYKGTIDSAHDGEVLGRKMSEVWVPIRAVGGTALLLPLNSGYSTLQVAVLWLAIQGVGVADMAWSAALNAISTTGMVASPIIPDSRPLAANILRFETCAAAMNKQFQDTNRDTRIQPVSIPRNMGNWGDMGNLDPLDLIPPVAVYSTIKNLAHSRYTVVDYKWRAVNSAGAADNTYINPDVCGGISWKESWESSEGNANTKTIKAPIMAAHAAAVQAMIAELNPVATQIVAGQKPALGAIDTAADKYATRMRTAAYQAVKATNDSARADFIKNAQTAGWIFAGTWYNHIVKMNDVMQSTLNSLPSSEPISISDGRETQDALQNYQDAMAVVNEYALNRTAAVKNTYYQDTDVRVPREGEGAWEYVRHIISAPFMGAINQMTEEIAGSNLNHISQMKSFGDTIVTAGWALAGAMTVAAGTSNSWGGKVTSNVLTLGTFDAGAALNVISGVVTAIIIGVLFLGVTLSTYAPMIPYVIWVASVLNWFVLVIEAVLAAPLWAAAHIHPDGDDAVGKGGQGYMMILSLIMRPLLMLFGLMSAMLLTEPVTGLVNAGFMTAVSGVQADSTTGLVSFLAYVTIYVIMMTTGLHAVFSLIHFIPDNVPRWIGAVVSGPANPEHKEREIAGVFGGGVNTAKTGLGHGGKKPLETPISPSSHGGEGRDGGPSDRDLLG